MVFPILDLNLHTNKTVFYSKGITTGIKDFSNHLTKHYFYIMLETIGIRQPKMTRLKFFGLCLICGICEKFKIFMERIILEVRLQMRPPKTATYYISLIEIELL